jgi:glycine/D-amino acid oxidase-like deaminating enzyme
MTGDDQPLNGFIPHVEGLYALVAHPGVMLAPYLGRLAAKTIAGA